MTSNLIVDPLSNLGLQVEEDEERGLTYKVTGWTLLICDALFVAVFIPISLRVGSSFWLWYALLQGAAGMGFTVAGERLCRRAIEHMGGMRVVEFPMLSMRSADGMRSTSEDKAA